MFVPRSWCLFSRSSRILFTISAICSGVVFWFLYARSNVSVASIQRISSLLPSIPSANTTAHLGFPFPKKIWQTGPPIDSTRDNTKSIASWSGKNPDFRYEFLTDKGAEEYVSNRFGSNSRIIQTFGNITDVILRADFLRLLVMSADGGVYSDIDTNCLVPVLDWIPEEYYTHARLVLGIEADLSEDDVSDDRKKELQICQWTIMAAPGNKHLEKVIDLIIDRVEKVAEEKGVSISDLGKHITVPEVITTTGPKAFTSALFESLSMSLGEPISTPKVAGLRAPQLIDDVLFLPVNAFAGHQVHSHSGDPDRGRKLVQHHYASSWWKAKDEQQT